MHSNIVLIIDDDEDDRIMFTEALREVNPAFTCKQAYDGIDALEHLEKTILLPDMIFLDINMPRLGGFECLQKIKESSRLKNIPVAIYSTAKDKYLEMKAYKLGAVCFIQKPLHFKEIVNCVRSVITEYIN